MRPSRIAAALVLWSVAAVAFYGLVPHPAYFDARYGVTQFYDGAAANPFARRALAPALVRAGVAIVPRSVRAAIDARLAPITSSRGGRPEHGTVIAVSAALTIASIVAFLAVLTAGIRALGAGFGAAVLSSLLAVPILHVFTNFSVFVYDHFVLALFAATTLRLWRSGARDRAVDVWIAVTALAKETAILLPIAAFAVDDGPLRERAVRLARRGAIVVALQALLAWSVSDRPGALVEVHVRENLALAAHASSWFVFEPFDRTVLLPNGLPFGRPVGLNLLVWLPIAALGVVGARREPRLGRMLAVMAVPLVALQFAFGVFNEVRNFYELLPALLWLAAAGVLAIAARDQAPGTRRASHRPSSIPGAST